MYNWIGCAIGGSNHPTVAKAYAALSPFFGPPTATLLMAAAGVATVKNRVRGAGNTAGSAAINRAVSAQAAGMTERGDVQDARDRYEVSATGKAAGKEMNGNAKLGTVGTVSLKHVFEIAKIKQTELRLSGTSLQGLCRAIIHQCKSIGINVVA